MAKNVRCRLEFSQRHQDWTIHDLYRVIFNDETKVNQFQYDGRTWYWVRDGKSQLQAHHMSQIVKHEGCVVFVWGCMTSRGMGYMCKIEGKMARALYLSTLQDGVIKTIEWYPFNLSRVMF